MEPQQYELYPEEFWHQVIHYLPDSAHIETDRSESRTWHHVVFASAAMEQVVEKARTASLHPIPVTISGETGTGKEILARSIHLASDRSAGPFIALNCSAIPHSLFESELFGFRRGAFTGASTDKPGLIELSDKGTLFLDEVAELPTTAQAKLLRVLNDRVVQRVGDLTWKKVDFRLITATHQDLDKLQKSGQFRSDLFYRIYGISLHLPPLRERPEDIIILARIFAEQFCRECQIEVKTLSSSFIRHLLGHSWPGNIRELENAVRVAAAMARDESRLTAEHLQFHSPEDTFCESSLHSRIDQCIRDTISRALKICGFNRQKTASILGVTPQALGYQMRRLNIIVSRKKKPG